MSALEAKIVAISGGTASGKSTFARQSHGAAVVSTDDFYLDIEDLTPQPDGSVNWEDPQTADLAACRQACRLLAQGQTVELPIYDKPSSKRRGYRQAAPPAGGLVIIEGLFAFEDQIASLADILIFLDVSMDVRRSRRLERDMASGVAVDLILANLCNAEAAEKVQLDSWRQRAHVVLTEREMLTYWEQGWEHAWKQAPHSEYAQSVSRSRRSE